jgi:7-carboxy-7-deazaguanine synthase
MTYAVKEIYYTLQGEGGQAGQPAVFCRFAGCNLWSGREEDRASAACRFCDTDFVGVDGPGGGRFETAAELAKTILHEYPEAGLSGRWVVFTGGEPLLQLDTVLIDACHEVGIRVAVETNGTIPVPDTVDWICVSPKPRSEVVQSTGNELKLIYPQTEFDPSDFLQMGFQHFFLQPMDGDQLHENVSKAVQYCKDNPVWRLSLQTHKLIGIP